MTLVAALIGNFSGMGKIPKRLPCLRCIHTRFFGNAQAVDLHGRAVMKRTSLVGLLVLAAVMLLPGAALAQRSNCADCHFASPTAPAQDHLAEWERSAHGRNNVGCEKCHGGNPSTFEPFLAHRGILLSSNRASPVHRRNLPATCGTCHTGPFVAFQKSHHFELLSAGDNRVPTCTTCHSAVGALRPSPKVLEARCQQCHGPKGPAPRVERAAAARTLLEGVVESRELLSAAKPFIDRIRDKNRQGELREAYRQAEVPLVEAARSVHEFVFDNLKERLSTARQRIEALFAELAAGR